ncbi:MAG: sugar ABC transporter permease [Caldilineaceae bacterium]|nr:sugar ABC transporter permease [Caldilineaceae bacterium]
MSTNAMTESRDWRPRWARSLRFREAIAGYLLLLPWLLGLALFIVGPMVTSGYLSLTRYDMVNPARFVGLKNFITMFTTDRLFWPSMMLTFKYAAILVPFALFGSLMAAILLNQGLQGTTIFRTLYFLPHLTPIVAAAVLWGWIFNPDVGPVNQMIRTITNSADAPGWFRDPQWAMTGLIIMAMWGAIGGNTMLIFLAGLQGVPQELYEAAAIDGAGTLAKFRHVTLPMLTPTIFFNMVLGIIGALKVFAAAFVATQGGPAYATWFYALHIYTNAFKYFDMGYASALAWIFFFIMLFFTYIQFSASRRWVFYAGEVN